MKTKYLVLAISILFLGITSCNKEEKKDADLSKSIADVEANVYSDEFEKSADIVSFDKLSSGNNQNGQNGPLPLCAVVTIDYPEGAPFPKVITIDYGDVNCEVRPNLYKRGKEIISISDSLVNLDAERTLTFENYFINDNEVLGYKKLTNTGENLDGFMNFSIDNDLSIGEWTRVSVGTKIWIEGFDTLGPHDNVFLLDGSSLTTLADGTSISRTITQSLRIDRLCGYITEGIVSIVWNDSNTAILDYGDGSCDDQAVIFINDQEFEINLHHFGSRRIH